MRDHEVVAEPEARLAAWPRMRTIRASGISPSAKPIVRDLFSTTVAAVLVAAAGTLTYRLASSHFGPVGFGEYALVRRTVAVALPAVMVGVGVALPRQIAMTDKSGVSEEGLSPMHLFGAAFLIAAVALMCIVFAVAFRPSVAAAMFFGDARYRTFLPVVGAFLGGLCAQATCYGYLRGRLYIRAANVFLVLSLGASPLLAFAIGADVPSVLWANALLLYALSFACIVTAIVRQRQPILPTRRALRSLLHFGAPRVPGDFALAALMSFPSIAAVHLASVQYAGVVAFGTTLVTLAGTAVSPLSTVLLPHSAALVRDGKVRVLRDSVARRIPLLVCVAIVGTLVLELSVGTVVRRFLGAEYVGQTGGVRWMVAAVAPYAIFVALRSLNDAFYEKAVNAWNCYAALVACAASAALLLAVGQRSHAAEASFVASQWILAILTVWRVLAVKDGDVHQVTG